MDKTLKGESVHLVELNESFLTDYLKLVNDPSLLETTEPWRHEAKDMSVFDEDAIFKWLSGLKNKGDRKDFAIIAQGDQFVGEVVLNFIKEKASNIRIALIPDFFDKGYGTQAMRLAIKYGFEVLKLKKIHLDVFALNSRGLRVYEKIGFQKVAETQIKGFTSYHMEFLAD